MIAPPPTILELARQYVAAGLSVIPIRADGSKAPACREWKRFQQLPPADDELAEMFGAARVGIALVAGEASGNVEILDFDKPGLWCKFARRVEELSPGLHERLCHIVTPGGGDHLIYRCNAIEGNRKLAQEPRQDGRPEVLIETRGKGGYVVTVGSPAECHSTGRQYVHAAGPMLTDLTTIAPAERATLFKVAASFNRYFAEADIVGNGREPNRNGSLTPGDDFNSRAGWESILAPHGWTVGHAAGDVTYWRRPGKTERGWSATTGIKSAAGTELLCVFSSNAHPFEIPAGKTCGAYSRFAANALLNHGGDFAAAARDLAAKGFGARRPERNGHAGGAEPFEASERTRGAEPIVYPQLSCRELAETTFVERYIVDGILPERLGGIISGKFKSLKTTCAVDLAISVATGSPFLHQFEVLRPVRAGIMSAESGWPTLKATALRVCESKQIELASVDGLVWSNASPKLDSLHHLEALERFIVDNGLGILLVDPLYLALGAAGDGSANVFRMGNVLAAVTRLIESTGCGVVLIHHNRKGRANDIGRFDPPDLAEIAMAGFAEWARFWLLLGPRNDWNEETGAHNLWLRVGGSSGHFGLYHLDAAEGRRDDPGGRRWDVAITSASEGQRAAREQQAAEDHRREREVLQADMKAILGEFYNATNGTDTKRAVCDRLGRNRVAFDRAFARLVSEALLEPCTIKRPNGRTYDAFCLSQTTAETTQADASG